MTALLPDLRNIRNEVVFVLTLAGTVISELIVILGDADFSSTASLTALIPLLVGLVARTKVYGPDVAELLGEPASEIS
jgi:hypothetical protein